MFRLLLPILLATPGFCAEPPPWINHPGYRTFPVAPQGSLSGFSRVPSSQSHLSFTNQLKPQLVAFNRVTENGSGVALGDIDGDGWCDLYFCGLEKNNVLFRNLGNWTFEDITPSAGVACPGQLSTGATFGDVDGDGDLDLLVNSIGGGTRLFLNDGKGHFTEMTDNRLVRRFGSTSLSLADIDLDGDLDLYVANYQTRLFKDELPQPKIDARLENGRIIVTPPGRFTALRAPGGNAELFELGERDFLYINHGNGMFLPVSWTNGNFLDEDGQKRKEVPLDWGLNVLLRDLNGDFLPDILVCNDFFFSPDRILIQKPGAIFQPAPRDAFRKVSLASMAVDVADIDRDGLDDLFFAEMLSRDHAFRQTHRDNLLKAAQNNRLSNFLTVPEVPRNTLFVNRGDGTYAEIAELAGVDASEWSWGAIFLDVDLDGYEDLLIPTGHNHDVQDADILQAISQTPTADSIAQRVENLKRFKKLLTPILAFHNNRSLHFSEMQDAWGLNIPGIINGFACADLDNDGDLDLVANRLNDHALLLRNDTPASRIAVRLQGRPPNTRAIGAKVIVRGGPVTQQQTFTAGGRYLSCDDNLRVFAAGPSTRLLTVEVQWPNRTASIFSNLPPNHVYEFAQPASTSPIATVPSISLPYFNDDSALLNHRDVSPPFDDFQRQPMLPYSLSTQGPALAWFDLDQDGRDDLIIAGQRGGYTRFFKNGSSNFLPLTNRFSGSLLAAPQAGLLAARLSSAQPTLIVAHSNYESASARPPAVELRSPSGSTTLSGDPSSTGAMALNDVDADGDLDLFVAGRVLPGQYPSPASSRLFRNDEGKFTLDEKNSMLFRDLGLVTSAVFADIDGDGFSELLTALEWSEIRVWKNDHGSFSPLDVSISKHRGLWTSLAVGDFDNDGKLDFIAGNWGRNTRYQRFLEQPLRLYYGDFYGTGGHDLLEAIYNPRQNQYQAVAGLERLRQFLPQSVETIHTFAQYSQSGIDALLRTPASYRKLEVSTLDSICFLNRGSRFEAHPLPLEAQFAPIFGMAVADIDGDTYEDVILGQNLFDTHWETGSLDSGRPLLLRGKGQGRFETVSFTRSGLTGTGQQRAVALSDYNHDGRVDVAISQHNDVTKLFANQSATPGLRLRFQGSLNNPDAIGCRYQVLGENLPRPVREIQCGSGWLSQNSHVQIIPRPSHSARLAITWAPGRQSEFAIPRDANEVLVTEQGISIVHATAK